MDVGVIVLVESFGYIIDTIGLPLFLFTNTFVTGIFLNHVVSRKVNCCKAGTALVLDNDRAEVQQPFHQQLTKRSQELNQ